MSRTSSKIGNKIVGHVTNRATGPNASDQPKPKSSTKTQIQRPVSGKSTSTPPLSYSHTHKVSK